MGQSSRNNLPLWKIGVSVLLSWIAVFLAYVVAVVDNIGQQGGDGHIFHAFTQSLLAAIMLCWPNLFGFEEGKRRTYLLANSVVMFFAFRSTVETVRLDHLALALALVGGLVNICAHPWVLRSYEARILRTPQPNPDVIEAEILS